MTVTTRPYGDKAGESTKIKIPHPHGGVPAWALYDQLIAGLPPQSTVQRYLVGQAWTVVESDTGMGLAMSQPPDRAEITTGPLGPSRVDASLRDFASEIRSWDMGQAALGLAGLNSFYNEQARIEALLGRELADIPRRESVFATMAPEVTGSKVAVVGHFPGLEELARRCVLTILERRPQPGDLPDPACEYVLPSQDYVFITGMTLVNKTLPRLLELSTDAVVVLVGPSVPFSPVWFDWGVDILAGSVVTNPDLCWNMTCEGGVHEIWDGAAVRLQVRAEDFAILAGEPTYPTTEQPRV